MQRHRKVVFTTTLEQSEWTNTILAKGDLTEEITKLKNEQGSGIVAYGGGAFVSSLIKQGLIDEFHLFANTFALGQGMAIFKELDTQQKLVLEASKAFSCGIVLLKYRKAT
ncbi:dihydrofolate reductase family protein [Phormidesmis priestleyi]